MPTADAVLGDLAILKPVTPAIRFYGATHGNDAAMLLAERHGFRVQPGAWLGKDAAANAAELAALTALLPELERADTAIVGNEVLTRGDMGIDALLGLLAQARRQIKGRLATAEIWPVWENEPRLAAASDVIAAHIHPYWDGVPAERGAAYVFEIVDRLAAKYPGKPIQIAETGWPTAGPQRQAAIPSMENQRRFLADLLPQAAARGVAVTLVEAFDQPWKTTPEGPAGGSWGLFTVDRRPKGTFPL